MDCPRAQGYRGEHGSHITLTPGGARAAGGGGGGTAFVETGP